MKAIDLGCEGQHVLRPCRHRTAEHAWRLNSVNEQKQAIGQSLLCREAERRRSHHPPQKQLSWLLF